MSPFALLDCQHPYLRVSVYLHCAVSHAFIINQAKQDVLKGFVSNEMHPIAACQDITVSSW